MTLRHAPLFSGLALLVGALFIAPGCKQEKPEPPPPPPVTVATPEVRAVTDYRYFRGTTQSPSHVEIRARVQGFLKEIHFEEGRPVKKDQLLFTIEPEPFEASLDAAKAKVAQTDAALQLANADLTRATKLFEKNAVTAEELETRKAEVAVAKAQRLADVANLENAKINLSYTEIHSPIDGIADEVAVDPGNLVGGVNPTLLTKVVAMDPIQVQFDVNEKMVIRYLERVASGETTRDASNPLPAEMAIEGNDGFPHVGKVDFLSSELDQSTGTALLRAEFPNTRGLLYPGLSANIRLPLKEIPKAVLIDERALGTDLGGKYVLLVGSDNMVELRYVQLGALEDGMRVITSGLEPNERYIIEGLQRARPGFPVTPSDYKPPAKPKGTSSEEADDPAVGRPPENGDPTGNGDADGKAEPKGDEPSKEPAKAKQAEPKKAGEPKQPKAKADAPKKDEPADESDVPQKRDNATDDDQASR